MAYYSRYEIKMFLDEWRYGWFNEKQNNGFETNLIIFIAKREKSLGVPC